MRVTILDAAGMDIEDGYHYVCRWEQTEKLLAQSRRGAENDQKSEKFV